ncbi:unnamed protein product, partial [Polarella glacialis]
VRPIALAHPRQQVARAAAVFEPGGGGSRGSRLSRSSRGNPQEDSEPNPRSLVSCSVLEENGGGMLASLPPCRPRIPASSPTLLPQKESQRLRWSPPISGPS